MPPSVAAAFAISASYYQRPITDDVARLYASDVSDLPDADVLHAMGALRREPRRRSCPLPAEVRVQVGRMTAGAGPAAAEQIAARISGAITRYGYPSPAKARQFMGETGWRACEELGGYIALCQRLQADEMGTFHAQARELCRALLDAPPPQECRTALPEGQQERLRGLVEQVTGALGAANHGQRVPAESSARRAHG